MVSAIKNVHTVLAVDRANIMYPHSTAIKLVRSEEFIPHKTPSKFRRHYKLYNGYFTRHYIMTESIQDTSPRIHQWRNKKRVSEKLAPRIYPWSQCFNLKSKI